MKKAVSLVLAAFLIINLMMPISAQSSFLDELRSEYVNIPDEENSAAVSGLSFLETGAVYEKYEIRFSVNRSYTNPFDFEDISVNGIFEYPSGKTVSIPAFYMQPMQYKDYDKTLMTYNASSYSKSGDAYWCIRFSGDEVGEYRFRIEVNSNGVTEYNEINSFSLSKSDNKGYVKISDYNPEYFVNSADNSLFYGSGSNIAWVRSQFTSNPEHLSYEYFISKAAAAGTNLSRVWLCHWAWLEWMPKEDELSTYSYAGLGYYNQCISSALDRVFELCEQNNMRLILTLDDNDERKTEEADGEPTYDSWYYNPYSAQNGGPAANKDDYWSNEQVRQHYKNRLRYIVARWGYSSSLMSLNLWNDETAPTADIIDYLSELNGYTDSLVSNWRPLLFGSNYRYDANSALDYATSNTADGKSVFEKPTVTQECYYTNDRSYFKSTLQSTLWNELFSFSGAAMVWSHDTVDETDSWNTFSNVLSFAQKLPLNKYKYSKGYSAAVCAFTWENGGYIPDLFFENGGLGITLGTGGHNFAAVKLENPVLSEDCQGISFSCDASRISEDAFFRINLTTEKDGVKHTYMPWFGGEYYFTPDGGETVRCTVNGEDQWHSWLHIDSGIKGTYFIPLETLNAPLGVLEAGDQYGYNIFDDVGSYFEFVIQQSAAAGSGEVLILDDICWNNEASSVVAQNFDKYNSNNALSAEFSDDLSGFKSITARALGDIAWGKAATENRFDISEENSDLLLAGISGFLYGSNKNVTALKNNPTFIVNAPNGGEMVVELSEIGSGTNKFTVSQGGKVVSELELSGGRREVTDDERYIRIPLNAGVNEISLSNEGHDWISVEAYHFKFSAAKSEDCVSVKRMISENQQLCLVKNYRNGEIYSKVFGGNEIAAQNVKIPFYELKNGSYKLEIFDAAGGEVMSETELDVTENSYVADVSSLSSECIIKLTRKLIFGDSNGDNKLDLCDLVRMKKYMADSDYAINTDLADLNVNGSIEALDLSFLTKLLLGFDVKVGY